MPDAPCRHHDHPKGHPFHGPACPDSPEALKDRIRIAIADPHQVLHRHREGGDYEPVTSWSARAVRTVIASVAAHNPLMLLGQPDKTNVEFSVHWHGGKPAYDDPDPGTMMSAYSIPWLREAIEWGNNRVGTYGITWYTVGRRENHYWDNGVEFSTPWRRLQLPELFVKEKR